MSLAAFQRRLIPEGWPVAGFVPGAKVHFLHLPKCAGTSVRVLVQNGFRAGQNLSFLAGKHDYLRPDQLERALREFPDWEFSTAHFGSRIFRLVDGPLNVFTWLRNPTEAALSTAAFISETHEIDPDPKIREVFAPFAAAVRKASCPYDAVLSLIEVCRTKGFEWISPLNPQQPLTHLLSGRNFQIGPEQAVEKSIQTLRECFFVGIVERQTESLEMLSRFLPLRVPTRDFRANTTISRSQSEDKLTESQRAALREMLAPEYEVYEQGLRIWDLQRAALEREGWFCCPSAERDRMAMCELFGGFSSSGTWHAEDPVLGEEIYDMEFNEAASTPGCAKWRWTSPGDHASIRLPFAANSDMRVSLYFSEITPVRQLKALRASVGAEPLGLRYRGRVQGCYLFECVIPARVLSGVGTDLELSVDGLRLGVVSDKRRLGVALHRIDWSPL